MYVTEPPSPQRDILVIASGGLDSAVAIALADCNCERLHLVAFNYGQKHVRELESFTALKHYYDTHAEIFDISDPLSPSTALTSAASVALTANPPAPLLPRTWKPGRNLLMLAAAVPLAYELGCTIIAGGWHAEDYPGYPDCRPNFLLAAEDAIQQALATPIAVWAPLLNLGKRQIVALGIQLEVPFELTWSCYEGGPIPCGKCDSCIRRAAAFEANKLKDPALKEKT